jgi:hypothetical protein
LQIVATVVGLVLTPLWCVIAFVIYPWLVPADSVGFTGAYEEASVVALGLAVVSAVGLLLAGGAFRTRRTRWIVATVLIAGHVAAACRLELYRYPLEERGLLFLSAQLVSVAVVIVGAAWGLPEPA